MPATADVSVNEDAIVFGTGAQLVGVVTSPVSTADRRRVGVILLNAGVVHRVGPSRLYVTLARRLSRAGFTTLRFDHSGIGDSPPREDHRSFDETSVAETVDAMNWLKAQRDCESFVLLGLCSGTLTAFRVAQIDERVRSLVLLTALLVDPSTVPEETIAEAADRRIARSYLVEKSSSMASWRRVLSGKVDYRRVWRVVRRLLGVGARRGPAPADAELIGAVHRLLRRGVSILFVYAEPTTVLEWFRMTLAPALPALRKDGRIELDVVRHADHTFTELRHQSHVTGVVSDWLGRCT